MNIRTTLGVVVAASSMLASVPNAVGAYINNSGTICKNYNASEVGYIDYFSYGTRSLKSGYTTLVCPLGRIVTGSNGATAYVDVVHAYSSNATTCTLYSYSYYGSLLGSRSASTSGSGFHEITLSLTGSGKSNTYSDYSILCSIPGSGQGVVYDVDLSE